MSYRLLNNVVGWAVFVVATTVYMLTLEPTTSLWDCGEYITTANQLEVGHPPGAPLFMMLGRIFSAFFSPENAAWAVNAMSGLSSSFSILFLFWSITMLARKLAPNYDKLSAGDKFAILASGAVGALAYTFSDSFWFSAVEGEVYAMSSFFTAVVFWAILKWETVAHEHRADRWLVLIFFLMGLSIGVHLLNLLAIPAICFVYYFKKFKYRFWGLVLTGIISIVILGLIQAVIIPGIVDKAAWMERIAVNSFNLGFNSGALIFFVLLVVSISLALYFSQKQLLTVLQKIIFSICFILLLGLTLGWGFLIPGIVFAILIFTVKKFQAPALRIANMFVSFILVLMIGYSTFTMIVIRSNANPPLDENNPETLTSLSSYLKREQYGSWPIGYGPYWNAPAIDADHKSPTYMKAYVLKNGPMILRRDDGTELAFNNKFDANKYNEENGLNATITSKYIVSDDGKYAEQIFDPRYCTVFPRMYRPGEGQNYIAWSDYEGNPNMPLPASQYGDQFRNMDDLVKYMKDQINRGYMNNNVSAAQQMQKQLDGILKEGIYKPTMTENLKYMFRYQFGWMYFRYFLWNFAGRQNDLQGYSGIGGGDGKYLEGNWLSGVNIIDESRLGPQEGVPHKVRDNKGYNKYYFLPLILALIGLIYHLMYKPKDWFVVLLLFIFTGIAICIYLNQKPAEPRERDYAYAASFYAFSIWIGVGVWALYDLARKINWKNVGLIAGAGAILGVVTLGMSMAFGLSVLYMTLIAVILIALMLALKKMPEIGRGIVVLLITAIVPILMGMQNWDDHDRSNRYSARDIAKAYLDSCDPNAILFTHGDNDTFPLWYVQEVEKYRTDVRVVNLSLLGTDWHVNQSVRKAYDSEPVPFTAEEYQYRQGTRDVVYHYDPDKRASASHVPAIDVYNRIMEPSSLRKLPNVKKEQYIYAQKKVKIPVNKENAIKYGIADTTAIDLPIEDELTWTIKGTMIKSDLMVLDLLAHYDWTRPIYFAGNAAAHGDLQKYFQMEGLTYKLSPYRISGKVPVGTNSYTFNEKKTYDNFMTNFSFGNMQDPDVFVDYYTLRMVRNLRFQFSGFASELIDNGKNASDSIVRQDKFKKAEAVLDRCFEVMPLNNVAPDDAVYHYLMRHYFDLKHENPNDTVLAAKVDSTARTLVDNRLDDLHYFSKLDESWAGAQLKELGKALYHLELMRQSSISEETMTKYHIAQQSNQEVDDKDYYGILYDTDYDILLADIGQQLNKMLRATKDRTVKESYIRMLKNRSSFPPELVHNWMPHLYQ